MVQFPNCLYLTCTGFNHIGVHYENKNTLEYTVATEILVYICIQHILVERTVYTIKLLSRYLFVFIQILSPDFKDIKIIKSTMTSQKIL